MTTGAATIRFLLDQAAGAGSLSGRKMFGEYGLSCDSRVMALVCVDTLYLKATPGALSRLAKPHFASPYPGAKPHLRLEDELDAPEVLARLGVPCRDKRPAAASRPDTAPAQGCAAPVQD